MGMFDWMNGKVFCPVCFKMTDQDMQTKAFQCLLDRFDMQSPDWSKFQTHHTEDSMSYIEHHYDPKCEMKGKHWFAHIHVMSHCNECELFWGGEVIYYNPTYRSRVPTLDWEFRSVRMDEIIPDSLFQAIHGFKPKNRWLDATKAPERN